MNKEFVLIVFIMIFASVTHAATTSTPMDDLMKIMVERGVMTKNEMRAIQKREKERQELAEEERRKEFEREVQNRLQEIDRDQSSTPAIVKNIKLTGEVGVRFQQSKTKDSSLPNNFRRNQGRLHYRLGIDTRLNDKVAVAAAIASGNGDPRSSYSTFTHSSENFPLELDYVYGEWKAASWAHFIVGQYVKDNYLWTPSDMMWDSDIRPQGGAMRLEKTLGYNWKVFFNSDVSIISELSSVREDPTLYFFQPGIQFQSEHFDLKTAANRYIFHGIKGTVPDYSACTNTGLFLLGDTCSGSLSYTYNLVGASAEVGYRLHLGKDVKRVTLYGDMVRNQFVDKNHTGWSGGIKLGDEKIDEFGDWQATYQYTYLAKDAVPDFLPNSDRYDGSTNIQGIKAGMEFGLSSSVSVGANYYRDDFITGERFKRTSILGDINFRF